MTTSTDTASSQVITEYGKQNIFGRETQPQLVEDYTSYPEEAEKTNGRWAMIGNGQPFGFILHNRSNHSWNFLNQ